MGGIRQQFTLSANVRMVQYSVDFYRDLDRRLSVANETQRVDFRQRGYLFLADAASAARLTRRYEAMRFAAASVTCLSRSEIQARLPDAWLDDIEFGLFGPDDGYANPKSRVFAMRKIARDAGVEYVRAEVSSISRTDHRVTGVAFGADSIDTQVIVNAAGPFAAQIADLAGVSLPVAPVRQPSPSNPADAFVDGSDASGGWAGLYEMTPDHSPIIGEHPDVSGFFLANGFSGHGLMMAPATGRAVAECITNVTPRTIDVSVFAFDRFRTGALLPTDATI